MEEVLEKYPNRILSNKNVMNVEKDREACNVRKINTEQTKGSVRMARKTLKKEREKKT